MKPKQALYPIFNALALPFSLQQLIQQSEQFLLLPVYHTVSNRPLPHLKHLYPIKNSKAFEADVDFLLQHFKPVSALDIQRHITGEKPIKTPSFHLSFDDGMRDCIETIAPILQKKGVSATFFINNDFTDNQSLFFRHHISILIERIQRKQVSFAQKKEALSILSDANLHATSLIKAIKSLQHRQQHLLKKVSLALGFDAAQYLQKERPYMTLAEVQQLHQQGFHIGAHSVNHPYYQHLSLEEQLQQTKASMAFVQKHFPSACASFAFPYTSTDISMAFFDKIKQEVNASYGTSGLKIDSVKAHLHRLPMEGVPFSARTIIKGEYFFFLLKMKLHKHHYERS